MNHFFSYNNNFNDIFYWCIISNFALIHICIYIYINLINDCWIIGVIIDMRFLIILSNYIININNIFKELYNHTMISDTIEQIKFFLNDIAILKLG